MRKDRVQPRVFAVKETANPAPNPKIVPPIISRRVIGRQKTIAKITIKP